jgi:hypothetical protein
MKPVSISLFLAPIALVLSGCSGSFYARGPEDYKQATRALLEARQDQFKACYEGVIKDDPNAAGTVAVHFIVEEKTGKITTPTALPESSAPEPLRACVVQSIDGLALDPPDQRKGDATMVFEFARG